MITDYRTITWITNLFSISINQPKRAKMRVRWRIRFRSSTSLGDIYILANWMLIEKTAQAAKWYSYTVIRLNKVTFSHFLFFFFVKQNLPLSWIPIVPLKQNSTNDVLFTWGRHKYWLLLYLSFSHWSFFDAWIVSFSFFGHSFTKVVSVNKNESILIITCMSFS